VSLPIYKQWLTEEAVIGKATTDHSHSDSEFVLYPATRTLKLVEANDR
jgi:hypothetical protein